MRKAVLLAVLLAGGTAWWWWRPFRIEIEGRSMEPTLGAGDWAIVVRAGGVRAGQVLVVEHPERRGFELVKRVVAGPGDLAPDGRRLGPSELWVQGDRLEGSTDSRVFGAVDLGAVRGRVAGVWWPPGRLRLL